MVIFDEQPLASLEDISNDFKSLEEGRIDTSSTGSDKVE